MNNNETIVLLMEENEHLKKENGELKVTIEFCIYALKDNMRAAEYKNEKLLYEALEKCRKVLGEK